MRISGSTFAILALITAGQAAFFFAIQSMSVCGIALAQNEPEEEPSPASQDQINGENDTENARAILTCPVDGTVIEYELKELPAGHLIEDRDFCIRLVPNMNSFRTESLYPARLAKCPTCGFTAPPDALIWQNNDALKRWYRATYPNDDGNPNQALIAPPWEDFERLSLELRAVGASEREQALAWLDASFCLRTAFWQEHRWWENDLGSVQMDLAAVTPADVQLPTPKTLYEESIEVPVYFEKLLFDAARAGPALGILGIYWLARGETNRVECMIAAMSEIEDVLEGKLAGTGPKLLREVESSGIVETMRRYQVSAAEYFERALDAGQITPVETPVVYYHLGELYRRTGDMENAERYYRLSLGADSAGEDIIARAEDGLNLVEVDGKLMDTLSDFISGDFIDDMQVEDVLSDVEPLPVLDEADGQDTEEYFVGDAIEIK